jgi:hypothetical protein
MTIKIKRFFNILLLVIGFHGNCFAWHSKVVLWVIGGIPNQPTTDPTKA